MCEQQSPRRAVTVIASPTRRSGPTRAPSRSDQRPAAIRSTSAPAWIAASTAAASPVDLAAARLVQEVHDEAHHRDLRDDVEAASPSRRARSGGGPAASTRAPRPAAAPAAGGRGRTRRRGRRSRQADAAEEDERPALTPHHSSSTSGQAEGRDDAADRHRGLPDAQREAAFPRDRTSASPRGRWTTLTPRCPSRRRGRARTSRGSSSSAQSGAAIPSTPLAAEADAEHQPLARPVGEEPPRQQAHDRAPDPARREHEADLGEREAELVPLPSAGAITGRPIPNAAFPDDANVPAAIGPPSGTGPCASVPVVAARRSRPARQVADALRRRRPRALPPEPSLPRREVHRPLGNGGITRDPPAPTNTGEPQTPARRGPAGDQGFPAKARRGCTAACPSRRSRSSSRGRARASRCRARGRSRTACSRRTGRPGTRCTAC